MKACQLVAHGAPGRFELRDLPPLTPAPGEVVVTVKACGLNRLDLWLEEAGLPVPVQLPRTPGCEIAGVVARVGQDVEGWKEGDPVAVQSNLFCGECEFCLRGDESMCLNGMLLGIQRDGGFAEEVATPARALVRLPEGLGFAPAAGLTLAGSTAMHMLTNRTQVKPGDWVLVMGASSGVGSAAIQIARQLGAQVITTASSPEKKALGERLGAHYVVDSSVDTWSAAVRKITNKRGVDVVVEHIGGKVLEQVFTCLARGGTVVTCGATAGRQPELNLWPFFVKQQKLVGSYGRNRADLQAALAWAAEGKLQAAIDRTYPLSETPDAFLALRRRTVLGKLLVTP